MNIEELRPEQESNQDVSLKVVSDNVVSLNAPVDNVESQEIQAIAQEPRCQNGVCTLNWKPRRVA